MSVQLRPMTLGEILDRTFQIYRSRFLVFIGIAALPALAMMAVHFIDAAWLHVSSIVQPHRRGGIVLWSLVVGLGFYHISGFFASMVLPAYAKQVASSIGDEACSLRESVEFGVVAIRNGTKRGT